MQRIRDRRTKNTSEATGAGPAAFEAIEDCAGRWATEAGERLAAQARGSLHIEYKGTGTANPVSEADREAEEFLYQAIAHRFPDHTVIGEEGRNTGPDGAPFVWVVDPLDGTSNYINGLSTWCVSVGVLWYGVPVAGAIWTPVGPDGPPALFTAHKGAGARLNGRAMHVNSDAEPVPSRLGAMPVVYLDQLAKRRDYRARGEPRTIGSIALELALTACGTLQFSAFWVPRIWDVAAGAALVREAGGTILQAPTRTGTWSTFESFEAPSGGLRDWQSCILAANSTLAAALSERVQTGENVLASLQSIPPASP